MGENGQRQVTVAERKALVARLHHWLAIQQTPQEEAAPPVYPGWTSYANSESVDALAACQDALWVLTKCGVVRRRWAGEAVYFTRYGSEHGLPGGHFGCIALDVRGRPWVGGREAGISYLDGMHWRTLTLEHGLPSPDVLCVACSGDGELWVGTTRGLGRISLAQESPRWEPYDLSGTGLPAYEIKALAVGPENSLWLGTSWGLYGCGSTGASWHRYTTADGLPDNEVSHLVLGTTGCLWVGTARGLCVYDGERFVPCSPVSGAVWSIAADRESGVIWVVAVGEVWRYAAEEWRQVAVSTPWKRDAQARAVALNDRGKVWIGFDSGLAQLVPEHKVLSMPRGSEAPDQGITALAIDGQQRAWAGTQSGLWVFEGDSWRRLGVRNELDAPLTGAVSIVASPTGELWVGSWASGREGGLRRFVDGVEIPLVGENAPRSVDALAFAPDGHLWAAAQGSIWRLDGDAWSKVVEYPDPGALAQALVVGGVDRLWCGLTTGLYCYENGRWGGMVIEGEINALVEDTGARLWIGASAGLYYVEDGALQNSEVDLPSEEILALAVAADGRLWIGMSNGLACLRDDGLSTWRAQDSGLIDDHIRALAVSECGTVWIGTTNGVSRFSPCQNSDYRSSH